MVGCRAPTVGSLAHAQVIEGGTSPPSLGLHYLPLRRLLYIESDSTAGASHEPYQRTRNAKLALTLSPPLPEWMLLRSFSNHASLSKIGANTRPLGRHAYGGGRSSYPGRGERQRQNHHRWAFGTLTQAFRSRPLARVADCDTTRWFSPCWRVSDFVDQSPVAPDEPPFPGHCSTAFGNALSSLSEVHSCSSSRQDLPHWRPVSLKGLESDRKLGHMDCSSNNWRRTTRDTVFHRMMPCCRSHTNLQTHSRRASRRCAIWIPIPVAWDEANSIKQLNSQRTRYRSSPRAWQCRWELD